MKAPGKPAGNSVKKMMDMDKLSVQRNSHREKYKKFLSGEVQMKIL
jgi:hypothetical protein